MVFSDAAFIFFFLPCLLFAYYIIPRIFRNFLLLLASLCFCAWGGQFVLILILVSITFNYLLGLGINFSKTKLDARNYLILNVIGNLGLLGFFKYTNFLVNSLNIILGYWQLPTIIIDEIPLPIGISFFTFQAMSYVIDVYRQDCPVQKNPLNFALYITLFPQLIAGPIVRYIDIADQLPKPRISVDNFAAGCKRFIIGLSKKLIIADTLAVPAVRIFALPSNELTLSLAWLAVICYSLQIYFDFAGYSDMAIGLGKMFGFDFCENFNYPYISRSITEFWRRWHLSLSTWFRDYLYIPLGGNRCSPRRVYFNLMVVFFLCGLWHGASWNFVFWGVFHGSFLILERQFFSKDLRNIWVPIQHLYTCLIVLVGWVFFRLNTLSEAFNFIGVMLGRQFNSIKQPPIAIFITSEVVVTMIIAIICSTPIVEKLWNQLNPGFSDNNSIFGAVGIFTQLIILVLMFGYCLLLLAAGNYTPFLYFQF